MIIKITLHLFIALCSNGDNIGTTDYKVYKTNNQITIEVL